MSRSPAPTPTPLKRLTKPMTRAEKSIDTRRKLISATAELVGRVGYAEANIARIADAANVAQGTIYNYFSNRQDIFDILLPSYAAELLDFMRAEVDPQSAGVDRDVERLRVFLEFVREKPWFVRLVVESQALAPVAYKTYAKLMTDGYVRALKRSVARREIVGYEPGEIKAIATALLAVRTYYAEEYVVQADRTKPVPKKVFDAYRKLVKRALFTPINEK